MKTRNSGARAKASTVVPLTTTISQTDDDDHHQPSAHPTKSRRKGADITADEAGDDDDDDESSRVISSATQHAVAVAQPQNQEDDDWDLRYKELVAYANKNGDCLVPRRYPPNSELAIWVTTQRRLYRLQQQQELQLQQKTTTLKDKGDSTTPSSSSSSTTLTSDRIRQLEALGFCWQDVPTAATVAVQSSVASKKAPPQDRNNNQHSSSSSSSDSSSSNDDDHDDDQAEWKSYFASLQDFVAVQGHANVPNRFPNHPKLSRWIVQQRQLYKQQQQQQKRSVRRRRNESSTSTSTTTKSPPTVVLTKERQTALESIGFQWNAELAVPSKLKTRNTECDAIWNQRYQELQAYHDQHGNCHVPTPSAQNPSVSVLAQWVKALQKEYDKQEQGQPFCLSDAQLTHLEKLDFCTTFDLSASSSASISDQMNTNRASTNSDNEAKSPPTRNTTSRQRKSTSSSATSTSSSSPPSVSNDPWQTHFQMLVQYQSDHDGMTSVPRVYPPNQALADWVHQQRQSYQEEVMATRNNEKQPSRPLTRRQLASNPHVLTTERQAQLNSIHFDWNETPPLPSSPPPPPPQLSPSPPQPLQQTESKQAASQSHATTSSSNNKQELTNDNTPSILIPSAASATIPSPNLTKNIPAAPIATTAGTLAYYGAPGHHVTPISAVSNQGFFARMMTSTAMLNTMWVCHLEQVTAYVKDHDGNLPDESTVIGRWLTTIDPSMLSLEQQNQLQALGALPKTTTVDNSDIEEKMENDKNILSEKKSVWEDNNDDDDDEDDVMLSSFLKPRSKKTKTNKIQLTEEMEDDDIPLISLKKKKQPKELRINVNTKKNDDDEPEEDDIMLSSLRRKKPKRVVHNKTNAKKKLPPPLPPPLSTPPSTLALLQRPSATRESHSTATAAFTTDTLEFLMTTTSTDTMSTFDPLMLTMPMFSMPSPLHNSNNNNHGLNTMMTGGGGSSCTSNLLGDMVIGETAEI